jgi:hypothetical protein
MCRVWQVQRVADAASSLLCHIIITITVIRSFTACSSISAFSAWRSSCAAYITTCGTCNSSAAALIAWLGGRQLHL